MRMKLRFCLIGLLSSATMTTAWAEEAPWRVAQPDKNSPPPVVKRYLADDHNVTIQPVQLIVPQQDDAAPKVSLGKPTPKLGRPTPISQAKPKTLLVPDGSIIETAGWDTYKPLPRPQDDNKKETTAPKEQGKDSAKEPSTSELLKMPQAVTPAPSAAPMETTVPPSSAFVYSPEGPEYPPTVGAPVAVPEGPVFVSEGEPLFGHPFGFYGARGPHGPTGRFRANFEFLFWTIADDTAPPLVSTSPQFAAGILGPDTTVTFGDDIGFSSFRGGRVSLGYWFSPSEQFGMEGSFFILNQQKRVHVDGSAGDPLYARPFYNALTNQEDSELVSALNPLTGTNGLSGSVQVENVARLLGADLNFRGNLLSCTTKRCNSWHVDGIAGFRYLRLDESLTITENLQVQDLPPDLANRGLPAGGTIYLQDRFAALNNFYGAQIGLLTELRIKRWFVNLTGKIAFGATQQQVSISGTTTFGIPGAPSQTYPAGLLAQGTNSGTHYRTVFSIAPEFGVNLGYQLTDHCRLYVGYDILVWTNVARPGRQIDRNVNPSQLPTVNGPGQLVGAPRPAYVNQDSTFWAQGLVAGLEWRF